MADPAQRIAEILQPEGSDEDWMWIHRWDGSGKSTRVGPINLYDMNNFIRLLSVERVRKALLRPKVFKERGNTKWAGQSLLVGRWSFFLSDPDYSPARLVEEVVDIVLEVLEAVEE